MIITLIILVPVLIYVIPKLIKGSSNSSPVFNDKHFKQGDVYVEFATGKLAIKKYSYNVNQVTKILSEPYTSSHKHGASRAWKAIIEVDDFNKPRHEIMFLSRKTAEEFTQRLSVAIRKAGGTSFS